MALIEINWKPDARRLRCFGCIGLAVLSALGAWAYFRQAIFGFDLSAGVAAGTAYGLWTLSAVTGLLAAVAPAMLRPLYVGMSAVSLPIGFVVSHMVMALIFYGVFTPFALFFRLIGRDSLNRKFDPAAESYWVACKPTTDSLRYYRQF